MFSISQTSRGFFCLEWSSTEDGPKITKLKHLKIPTDFSSQEFLENITISFSSNLKSQTDSLSIVLDSSNVLFSLIKIDLSTDNEKLVRWYEKKIMGDDFCKSYYNYYFPMDSRNNCLLVSLPKKIKDDIVDISKKSGFNLVYLSVDIFSASILARQIHKKETKGQYLIWKIKNNNHHSVVVFNGEKVKLFLSLILKSDKINIEFSIGPDDVVDRLILFIKNIFIHKKSDDSFKNIFIYQTKENKNLIKNIIDKYQKNIKLLDVSMLVESGNYDKFQCLPYVENGICFKGLDLV